MSDDIRDDIETKEAVIHKFNAGNRGFELGVNGWITLYDYHKNTAVDFHITEIATLLSIAKGLGYGENGYKETQV